eukprot:jgi/Undpi1/13431/HiC_scaffold_8.g03090.m1
MASVARAAAARMAQCTSAARPKILGVVARSNLQARHASGAASSSSKAAIAAAIAGVAGVVGAGAASLVVADGGGESGGGAWGRRGMSQGKYYGLKKEEADGMTVQGEDDKFFDADYAYLMVVGGSSNKQLAAEIAAELGLKCGAVTLGRYADGEVMVQLDEHVRGKDVYIVQSGQKPVNDNLVELLLMVSTMQRASAKPADVGRLLEVMGVDRVIAVDLERPGTGSGGAFLGPGIPVETLLTTNIFPSAGLVKKAIQFKRKLREYVDDVRVQTFLHARPNSGPVDVSSNELMGNIGEVKGRDVIIVDELIDTGGTLGALPRRLRKAGAKNIYVCSSHGLFNANAMAILEESPVDMVFVTNSVPLPEGCKSEKIEQGAGGEGGGEKGAAVSERKSAGCERDQGTERDSEGKSKSERDRETGGGRGGGGGGLERLGGGGRCSLCGRFESS